MSFYCSHFHPFDNSFKSSDHTPGSKTTRISLTTVLPFLLEDTVKRFAKPTLSSDNNAARIIRAFTVVLSDFSTGKVFVDCSSVIFVGTGVLSAVADGEDGCPNTSVLPSEDNSGVLSV